MSTLATNSSGNGKEQMSCGGSSSGSNSIAAAGGGNRRPRNLSQPDIFSGAEVSVQRRRRLGRARRASVASLVIPGVHVTPPTPREIDISKLEFLFRKQLKNSDVGVLRRIVLPKVCSLLNFKSSFRLCYVYHLVSLLCICSIKVMHMKYHFLKRFLNSDTPYA
ncbi:hypothetical protein ACS0TY_004772 [Phlomoides rotata]